MKMPAPFLLHLSLTLFPLLCPICRGAHPLLFPTQQSLPNVLSIRKISANRVVPKGRGAKTFFGEQVWLRRWSPGQSVISLPLARFYLGPTFDRKEGEALLEDADLVGQFFRGGGKL